MDNVGLERNPSPQGPIVEIVVRNCGALITPVGAMLICGAFNPPQPRLVLTIAGTSKLVFICLLLVHGAPYLRQQAGVAVAIDLVELVLFATYLVAPRSQVTVRS